VLFSQLSAFWRTPLLMCCLRVNAWRETLQIVDENWILWPWRETLQIVDENWIILLSVTFVTTRPSY
jgi:hypothetical protein